MNRLTDTDLPPDSPAGALAAAVRALEPVRASPERAASVLVRVLLCRRAHPRPFFGVLSPAALSIALLAFGIATAAAAIAPHVRWPWPTPGRAPVVEHLAVAPQPTPGAAAVRGDVSLTDAPPAASPPRPLRPHPAAGESPARLMAAVRALRTDRQPARAEQLALAYLRAYPRGALAEEALAVAIEAAALNGDSRAVPLARRYLQQHPSGRFRRIAEQTLAQLR